MSTPADPLDSQIAACLSAHKMPGLSLAVIDDGRIVKEQGYGISDLANRAPITPAALFQAASISKCITALGVLHLVETGRLSLHDDVNRHLKSWQVPENEFTRTEKVTVQRLLAHQAGMTVHGFRGYPVDSTPPTLADVLEGRLPAKNPAIRVDVVPGSLTRYSGGGYTVLQQLIIDVTGQPFPEWMDAQVLQPMGMLHSTFEQILSPELAAVAVTGHTANGKANIGRWRLYPELAAAGLWTTAADLARFAIGLQQSFSGEANPIISAKLTRQMLTPHAGKYGLGCCLEGEAPRRRFYHTGRNHGFDSLLMAYADASIGKGFALLLNSNNDSGAIKDLFNLIARQYRWT